MEGKETSPLVRAFARARKDVVERMSGVDFAPMTPEEADAKWQRAEQEVLLARMIGDTATVLGSVCITTSSDRALTPST